MRGSRPSWRFVPSLPAMHSRSLLCVQCAGASSYGGKPATETRFFAFRFGGVCTISVFRLVVFRDSLIFVSFGFFGGLDSPGFRCCLASFFRRSPPSFPLRGCINVFPCSLRYRGGVPPAPRKQKKRPRGTWARIYSL